MKPVGVFAVAALLGATVAVAGNSAALQLPERGGTPDLILSHARVKTSAGWAEALAVRGGNIVAVGDAKTIEAMRGSATRVLDLGGSTVLPGLHDVHVHPLYAGLGERQCKIPQGSSLDELQQHVAACVKAASPGAWITGGQWDASTIGRVPDRAMLDAVAPDNPVLLVDTSGHSSLANSRALAAAGITRETRDPAAGIIERDSAGEPSGVFREDAMLMINKHVPPPTQQEIEAALKWSLDTMLSVGITSFTEAEAGFAVDNTARELAAYAALADQGRLKQRVRLCLSWKPDDPAREAAIASRNLYARERVRPDCVKIVLDGVPTDSHTAAMLQPYAQAMAGRDDEASRMGMLLVPKAALDAAVVRFDRMGLSVKFHAAGDASARAGLDAIEAARKVNGFTGERHDVGHCTFVAKADVARARALGASFEVSPYLWSPSPINDDITVAVGAARIERVWPVRELIESGALVVPGSDWSVVPSASPWIGMETLVTREEPGGSAKSFGKSEAITLQQAFDLFTVNSAKHEGVADRLGRIEPGLQADLIVVEKDPFEVPIRQLHATRVQRVFVAGEQVFEAAAK